MNANTRIKQGCHAAQRKLGEDRIRTLQTDSDEVVLIKNTAVEMLETVDVGVVGEDINLIVLLMVAKADAHKDIISSCLDVGIRKGFILPVPRASETAT